MADDLRQAFLAEARELSEQLMLGVLRAERQSALTSDERRHLLRLAHTLKGAARLVKERAIGDAAHAMEDLIAAAGDRLEPAAVTHLLTLIDTVTGSLPRPEPETAQPAAAGAAMADDARTVRVDLADINAAVQRVASLTAQLAALQRELDTSPAQARATADRLAVSVAALRTELHRMRLAPAGSVFATVERAVRDAAQASDVLVTFSGSGGEHRLDADVLDTLRDALIQVARNAVAHGIEPPRRRAAAGKPPEGRVALAVERRGTGVAFSIADDGRGLDVDGLRRAAAAQGHRPDLSEPDLIDLLLAGGLTSRRVPNQIAGRGVGLDLVRAVVARLHGELSVTNASGRGVTVDILVPASMRSLRYVRMESGSCAALLPLDALRGTLRLADVAAVTLDGRRHLLIDGETVPLLSLDRLLSAEVPDVNQIAAIVATGTGRLAVAAARFGEAAQTVAQALPPLTGATAVVRDIALDPDGGIVPVLEPTALAAVMADEAGSTAEPRSPRLLVVDDSVTSRMLEQSILEAAGFKVETAASAEEALRTAAQTAYDLFIVDVEMPGMNGFEFVEATRADAALARTPAILVTSRSSEADRRRGVGAGARGYVVKSEFEQDSFLDLVRRLVD